MSKLFAIVIVIVVCAAGQLAHAGYTLVPISGASHMAYDAGRQRIYVTTNGAEVVRYDLGTGSFLTPWSVGVNLGAMDLTADGVSLYVTEGAVGASQGVIRKVDLATGATTNLFYDLIGEGRGGYDIAVLGSGKAIFTTDHQYSGDATAVRFIDLVTDAITHRENQGGGLDYIERRSSIWRSADRSRAFLIEGNSSSGKVRIYDAASDDYLIQTELEVPLNGFSAGFSPNGSLIAFEGHNVPLALRHAADLSVVASLPPFRGPTAFTPQGLLVLADWESNLFRWYDPATVTEVASIAAGFDIDPFNNADMLFSSDGRTLVYQDGAGLRIYSNLIPEPTASVLWLGLVSVLVQRRRAG